MLFRGLGKNLQTLIKYIREDAFPSMIQMNNMPEPFPTYYLPRFWHR